MQAYYQYFVEGYTEKRILEVLKTDLQCVLPGKVQVFNVMQDHLRKMHLMSLRNRTTVILVFDTDKKDTSVLRENIRFLKADPHIKKVVCIPQVRNLEEELLRSCNIKSLRELTESKSNKDFKTDLLKCSNLSDRLRKKQFVFEKFWASVPDKSFKEISNEADFIRIKK